MRILLLGKYPPTQGGIAAKSYWLAEALTKRGISFDVVTAAPEQYRIAGFQPSEGLAGHRVVDDSTAPWFIPGGDLTTERLVAAALDACSARKPDAVEVNYLAPFGLAGLIVARELGVPLLVRHAGSDLAKLLPFKPVARAIGAVLKASAAVAATEDNLKVVVAAGARPERTVVLQRYVPAPEAFSPSPTSESATKILLVAGKLNFHWKWKALDSLLAAVRPGGSWRVRVVGDGTGRSSFLGFVAEQGCPGMVDVEGFHAPENVPRLLAECDAIWAVRRPEDIGDPSNLTWEAAAVGRPCFISEQQLAHPDIDRLRGLGAVLPVVGPDDPESIRRALSQALAGPTGSWVDFSAHWDRYVDSQLAFYCRAAGG